MLNSSRVTRDWEAYLKTLPSHALLNHFPRGVQNRFLGPTASWADPNQVKACEVYRPGQLVHGQIDGQLLSINTPLHCLTVAGTRGGKGISTVVPNLLTYKSSILCIDVKGELARITLRHRAKTLGQDCYVLDPWRRSGQPLSSFNPLDAIHSGSPELIDDASMIADSLIVREKDGSGLHWIESCRELIKGLILYVLLFELKGFSRNLIRMREILRDESQLTTILAFMQESEKAEGVLKAVASSFLQRGTDERGSVLSTARRNTEFLDSPQMRQVLSTSSGNLDGLTGLGALKQRPTTIYLCIPAGRLETHSRWLRLMVASALEAMERTPFAESSLIAHSAEERPVLFLMDEFYSLSTLKKIQAASGQIAGFGVKLWPVLQNLGQMKELYPDWETFLGNSGVTQWFANTDPTTLEYLSKRLGTTSIYQENTNNLSFMDQLDRGRAEQLSWSLTQCPLMTPDEIERFFSRETSLQLILRSGARPIVAERLRYYEHPAFRGCYDV